MTRIWATIALAMSIGLTGSGCSLFGSRALPQGEATHEWRATWVLNVQDDIKDVASAKQVVEEARELNLNTLFIAAVHQGTAYYPSQVVPIFVPPGSYRPLEFDPIQAIIDAAREKKSHPIQVFAWVNFANVWEQRGLIPPNHPVVQHPDWLTAHYDANRPPDESPEFWLDPGVPVVQTYGAEICRELAGKYALDGILLDSVQYRPGGFGYNPVSLQRFAQETGRLDRPAPADPLWRGWRAQQATNLVTRMTLAIRSQKPNLPVAVVGGAEGPFTPRFEDSEPFADLGQNWPAWLENSLADILVLRNFKRQANQQQAQEFGQWLAFAKIQQEDKALICGISGRDNTLLATQTQISAARAAGIQGVAIWRYRDNNTEGRPRKALFDLLYSTVFSSRAKSPELFWLTNMETGIVGGQVRTMAMTPLSNVRVQFPEIHRETSTLPDGTYVLFNVPAEITVNPQAYVGTALHTAERTVTVLPGQIGTADIVAGP